MAHIVGTNASDGLQGTSGSDRIQGLEGADFLQGLEGGDTLLGGGEDDGLNGGDGNDLLRGGDGSDTLHTSAGRDTLDGGSSGSDLDHVDLYAYGRHLNPVRVDLRKGTARYSDGTVATLAHIESVRGTDGADVLLGGNAELEVFQGGGGNDTINGRSGFDLVIVDAQGAIVNLSRGFAKHDGQREVLIGIEGVVGGSGDDILIGNSSDNLFQPSRGSDLVKGGGGRDEVDYSTSFEHIPGVGIVANLKAGRVENFLDDIDTLTGIEDVRGTVFDDDIRGDETSNRLRGDRGSDTLQAGDGRDHLEGNDGQDVLRGGEHNDTVEGGDSSDMLAGGTGNDSLAGGAGNDTFVFRKHGGSDVVSDFGRGADRLNLEAFNLESFATLGEFITQEGADTRIELDPGTNVLLMGVDVNELRASHFIL